MTTAISVARKRYIVLTPFDFLDISARAGLKRRISEDCRTEELAIQLRSTAGFLRQQVQLKVLEPSQLVIKSNMGPPRISLATYDIIANNDRV